MKNATRTTRRWPLLVALGVTLALFAAACGDSDDEDASTTETTSQATGTTTSAGGDAETVKWDREIQQQLADVGCYEGSIDGIIGPETDAAIVAFQEAEGLEADGEVGPETESALKKAADDGRQVCGATTGTTQASSGTTASTTPKADDPVCTAAAITPALPAGTTITKFACSGDWAGVQGSSPGNDNPIDGVYYDILQWTSEDGEGPNWLTVGQIPCTQPPLAPQPVQEIGCGPTGR